MKTQLLVILHLKNCIKVTSVDFALTIIDLKMIVEIGTESISLNAD